jgi:hypothetical protein
VDTGRPSTEAVPTPITGLKPHPERRRTYWALAGALALLSVGAPVIWLARRGEHDTPSAQKPPPPLPERAAGTAPKPSATEPNNVAQALPPEPPSAPAAPASTPAPPAQELAEPHVANGKDAHAAHEERKAKRTARMAAEAPQSGESHDQAQAPVSAPVEKSSAPADEHDHGDPMLRSDSNPYFRR